jgi:hypothetical protein
LSGHSFIGVPLGVDALCHLLVLRALTLMAHLISNFQLQVGQPARRRFLASKII